MILRDYQKVAVDHGIDFFLNAPPGARQLYTGPTGVGKSVVMLKTQSGVSEMTGKPYWIVTPRIEIVRDMLRKLGSSISADDSEANLFRLATEARITTPIRLRNLGLAGRMPEIAGLLIDEAHHETAAVYEQLHLLAGNVPAAGYTATPFRGTPRGTQAFRDLWGDPFNMISWHDSRVKGYIAWPDCQIVPLVDDDEISIAGGEFTVRSIESATQSRLYDAVGLLLRLGWVGPDRLLTRPSMVSLPSTGLIRHFYEIASAQGIPVAIVTQDTTSRERQEIFARTVKREVLLLQINVVSEGVDLPIRRLLDLSPTMSPVRWLQQVGRITRPVAAGEPSPEYICTNRNLLRHAYLLEGLIPATVYKDATEKFQGLGKRNGARVIGLESLGRMRPAALPLANGLEGQIYAVSCVEGSTVSQYCAIVHPLSPAPLWAKRSNQRGADGITAQWGRWQRCEAPADLTGFASLQTSAVTDKMKAWWARSARGYGLDASVVPNRKQFAALPVLVDTRVRIQ